jgi:arylsulfatase A-like enzyme
MSQLKTRRDALKGDISATVLNLDLAPTMLALAGAPIPPSMQGRDLSALWSEAALARPWRMEFLYEHYLSGLDNPSEPLERFIPSSEGVRDERYTYLRYPRQQGENEAFFDRLGDPGELKNIVHTAPVPLVEYYRKRTDDLIAQNT